MYVGMYVFIQTLRYEKEMTQCRFVIYLSIYLSANGKPNKLSFIWKL